MNEKRLISDGRHKIGAVWLFPLSFIVHDGEEILTMPRWIAENRELLSQIAGWHPIATRAVANLSTSTLQVATAVGFELLVILIATVMLLLYPTGRISRFFFAALFGAYVLHAISHLAQALAFGGYTPGVVTAVLIIPATGVYVYRRLLTARLLTRSQAMIAAAVGIMLLFPVVFIAHYVGRVLAG